MAETRQTGDEQNRTNPGEFGQNQTNRGKQAKLGETGQKRAKNRHFQAKTGQNGAKNGRNRAKLGKKRAKTGKKQANETEPWQNRAKPKVSPNLGSGSVIPGPDLSSLLKSADRSRLFLQARELKVLAFLVYLVTEQYSHPWLWVSVETTFVCRPWLSNTQCLSLFSCHF